MKYYTAIIVSLFALHGNAQWTSTSYLSKEQSLYQLIDNSGDFFCFPGLHNCNSLLIEKPLTLSDKKLVAFIDVYGFTKDIKVGFHQSFFKSVAVGYEVGRLTLHSYADNIKRCLVLIRDANRNWLAKEIYFERQGYNKPINIYLKSFSTLPAGNNNDRTSFNLQDIYLLCEPLNQDLKSKLVVGSLSIEEYQSHVPGDSHPWINAFLSGNKLSNAKMLDEYSLWAEERLTGVVGYTGIPAFDIFGNTHGYLAELIGFECQGSYCDEQTFLMRFVMEYLKFYPYYAEKGLDSTGIAQRISGFFAENASCKYSDFVLSTHEMLREELGDPHVEIILPSGMTTNDKRLSRGPVRLKEIGGNVMVAAVLNSELADQLDVGSVVTSIDGHLLNEDSEFEKLLIKAKEDSVSIAFRDPSDADNYRNLKIPYSVPVSIPSTFIPEHGAFKVDEDSVSYLYLSRWEGDASILLLNNRDKILHSKGLIIDLRGNGGGYSSDVIQTLSLFFSNPNIIGNMSHFWLRESIIVYPAPETLRFPESLKVSILIDNYTACASEIFLIGMKRRARTIVIGESNTKGAIATPVLFRFPSGLMFKGHTKFRQYVFDPNVYREGRGIEPDIMVSRTHPRDLYPYNDKIRKIASRVIKTF